MPVNNAAEAAEIVRQFLAQMGAALFLTPVKAERTDGLWTLEFQVGFRNMLFEVNEQTGEILRYTTTS